MRLDRDNWNLTFNHAWTVSDRALNQMWVQVGHRKFDEPNNSQDMMVSYSVGNTLSTGSNYAGDQTDVGDVFEVRDSFFLRLGTGRWAHDMKFGGSWQHVKDDWLFPLYPQGWLIYANDPPNPIPFGYYSGTGSSQAVIKTDLLSFFVQDDLRPSPRVTINVGLRYDIDTNGNNPDFTSPAMPEPRGRDTNNFQPRAGVSWDLRGDGAHVIRGGAGMFTGRFLFVPAYQEIFFNGYTGRITTLRLNVPPFFPLDPRNPATTGFALPPDAWRVADELVNPWSTQVTGGYTVRLGATGLFADFEGIYVKGEDEIVIRDTNWRGNGVPGGRPDPTRSQINTYTNEGRSEYKAFVASLNGTIRGGHVVTASWTIADKKNITDDFSPAVTDYPSDPADIEAEWGRSRADERYRFVASGVFLLPYRFTVAPIFSYGSGQPWNRRLGYDRNGDNRNSDRADGMPRFSADGPNFASMDLRLTYRLPVRDRAGFDLIAEAFNLFNRTNYDVNYVQSNEFRSGPTPANPAVPLVPNPDVGEFLNTLPPREFQLGVRFTF
jgi:hypothetical protein